MAEASVVIMQAAPSRRKVAHPTASLMAEESAVSMRIAPSLCEEESPYVSLMAGASVILLCAQRDYRRGLAVTILAVDMPYVDVNIN
jgi:hypothetical protein